ncbi:MAG: hypothetical protein ACPL7K_00500 [Armatimonadota bacterium]
MADGGELMPEVRRTASLSLTAGFGPMGERVTSELAKLLRSTGEAHNLAVKVWNASQTVEDLRAAVSELLSAANLDRLDQIPQRMAGQPLCPYLVCVIDGDEAGAGDYLREVLSEIEVCAGRRVAIAVVVGDGLLENLVSHQAVSQHSWDWILPFPAQEPSAGNRSAEDLAAAVARLLVVFSTPGGSGFGDDVFALRGGSRQSQASVVRVGAAFLDADISGLADCLVHPIAGELLERQYKDLKRYEPAATFDDERRTSLHSQICLDSLARRLLAETPFVLTTNPGEPWRVTLPAGIITAEVEGLPRRRWVAALLKLRDVLDFTKARRWAEAMEATEKALEDSLDKIVAEDVLQLHRYVRGPDRLLTWASLAQEILERQPDIHRPAKGGFDEAVERLKQEIATTPAPIAVWARVALLGLLGAAALRYMVGFLIGPVLGWAGFVLGLLAAAAGGAWILEKAHRRLFAALQAAQEALGRRYEALGVENLILLLDRLRGRLLARIGEEVARVRAQAAAAITIANSEKQNFGPQEPTGVVNVEWVIPAALRRRSLDWLALPWDSLHGEAARAGRLVPAPPDGPACMQETADALRSFGRSYILGRLAELGLADLIEFRNSAEGGFADRIVRDLDRRAAALAPRLPRSTVWRGPKRVLARFHDTIIQLDPDATENPSDLEMLACLKAETAPFVRSRP